MRAYPATRNLVLIARQHERNEQKPHVYTTKKPRVTMWENW